MSLLTRLFKKTPPPPETAHEIPSPASSDADRARDQVAAVNAAAEEERVLNAALDARDNATLARLVREGSVTRVRQQAARAIEDPELLRKLLRDTRGGSDKNAYKILRQKCDVLLAQERDAQQTEEAIEARCASLERHSKRTYDELFTPTLDAFEAEWKTLEAKANFRAIARAEHAIARGREVIAQHREKVAAQAAEASAAALAAAEAERTRAQEKAAADAAAAAIAAQRESDEKVRAEQRATEAQALGQIGSLIRKAGAALKDGSTARAAGLRRAVEEKLQGSPPLPAHLSNQVQQLDAKLNELKDWKDYAAAPKRAQLIEAMEALVASQDDPEELAVEIRRLQDDWKTNSKGVTAIDTDAEWQRFHEAAQKAYEPCKQHFEAQAQRRQENLSRRLALIERLAAFEAGHDWERADWSLVTSALRESRQEWRSHTPVDRATGKAAQEQFDLIVSRLQERLNGEYTRNVAERESLIVRAQQALASGDARQAIDDVKHLQQRWKAAGRVPHEEGSRLWDQFRQVCDAVFAKRQEEHAQYNAGLETNKAAAMALCENVERIATLTGQELTEGVKEIPALKDSFGALGELPKSHARELQRRFERALEKCEESIATQRQRAQEQSWTDLFEAANQVRAYRLGLAEKKEAGDIETLKQTAVEYIASVPHWPKGGSQAVKALVARPGTDDVAANELALRMLCIRAEILTERPTPQRDQALRREYQMKRLVEGMGQGGSAEARGIEQLALEWVGVGASRGEVYEELMARFTSCLSDA